MPKRTLQEIDPDSLQLDLFDFAERIDLTERVVSKEDTQNAIKILQQYSKSSIYLSLFKSIIDIDLLMELIKNCQPVTILELTEVKLVDDAIIEQLIQSNTHKLNSIILEGTNVSNRSVELLCTYSNIKAISTSKTPIDHYGIMHLLNSKLQLKMLCISQSQIIEDIDKIEKMFKEKHPDIDITVIDEVTNEPILRKSKKPMVSL